MPQQLSVALLIETSNAYARGLLRGIASYTHQNPRWSIYLPEQERGARPPAWLKNWRGDGLIARIENEAIARAVRPLKLPVVDVSAARALPDIPYIETDDRAIAALAYSHLRERGLRTFAYCGDALFEWSRNRQHAFEQHAAADGSDCHVFESRATSRKSPSTDRRRLTNWLRRLPKPVGLFACYDKKALEVLDICRQKQIKVPFEIAVLGADNDELLCDLCTPPLSSIIPAAEQTGREAAEMLDRMMRERRRKRKQEVASRLIPPLGIATRMSTDVVATEDAEIAAAVRFVRDHCCEGIKVEDILQAVPLSRRILERRFREIVGRTPHQEIMRRRIEAVSALLLNSDLTLGVISRQTGFQSQEHMSVAFKKQVGVPPGQYRRDQTATRNKHPD
ncbi:XylR family transcriptional regulator [Roseiconus nitratireducens]|uniref:XylR family transcriptional regulator n=1 Tax=Roseiconus nitratireducens TaxID=2605748 RepID=A0A5M6DJE9_9BACT|nr:XylR family transcriptional regulator [Roseiconus nitratireducens]KAA5545415.1 XylR family transcriptional regulator [Roseiconus nitratireducens]